MACLLARLSALAVAGVAVFMALPAKAHEVGEPNRGATHARPPSGQGPVLDDSSRLPCKPGVGFF